MAKWSIYHYRRMMRLCVDCGNPVQRKKDGDYYSRCEKCREKLSPSPFRKECTICWTCQRAVPKKGEKNCPWAERRRPVPGWNAIETKLYVSEGKAVTSYIVRECPDYKEDEN